LSEDEIRNARKENLMLTPKIDKVVVNLSVGKSGEPLERAVKVLEELTGQTPCRRKAKQSIRDFGIRQGESIACIVTLRKQVALDFLDRVLPVIDRKIAGTSFDRQGNFSFGIKEHIEIKGVKYDPDVGILGMDVCVSMVRPGYRIKNRRREKGRIGSGHVLTPEESMAFAKNTLKVEIM
jgi:large subunit ribosomal protein L5